MNLGTRLRRMGMRLDEPGNQTKEKMGMRLDEPGNQTEGMRTRLDEPGNQTKEKMGMRLLKKQTFPKPFFCHFRPL